MTMPAEHAPEFSVENTGAPVLTAGSRGITDRIERLRMLRAPFAMSDIGKLPKVLSKDDQDRGWCRPGNEKYTADGIFCGGRHAKAVHLDYVGHAAITNRFLEVDPEWNWEPMGIDAQGLPATDSAGGLWIRLTILGVTRLGYGAPNRPGKGPDGVKEAIGDALRNAGMRFGAGLVLWHKGDLSQEGSLEALVESGGADFIARAQQAENMDQVNAVWSEARAAGANVQTLDTISGAGHRFQSQQKGRR